MPLVVVPPPYQGPTQGRGEIKVVGRSVRECIEAVGREYPGFREQVLDGQGRVHRFVSLFLNGDELPREAAVETAVSETDRIEILAAIAGG
jgi:molybdopterin synthase sulfur carrier subunit